MPNSPTQLGYVTKVSDTADSQTKSWLSPTPLRLALHALALLVALIVASSFVWNGFSAFPDEGLYSMQAHQLTEGSWWGPRSAPDLDDSGLYNHIVKAQAVGDGQLAYTQFPLYSLVLSGGMFLSGPFGLMLVSLIGTWVAAVGASLIALAVKRSTALVTMWVTGLASPLIFGANIVLAHSLAAAGVSIFVLGLLHALFRDGFNTTNTHESNSLASLWHLAYALPALWIAISLRSEASVITGAVGAALGLVALGKRPVQWKWLGVAVGVVVSGATVYWLNTRWAASISTVDGHGVNPTDLVLSERTGPGDAMWTALFRPYIGKSANFNLVLAAVPIAAVIGSLALRIGSWKNTRIVQWIGIIILVATSGAAVYGALTHDGLISGLFAAFPVLGMSFLWMQLRDIRTDITALLLLALAIATVGLLLTIYADGGAQQWGGRFFHALLPVVCPLIVLFLSRLVGSVERIGRVVTVVALVVLMLSYSVFALRINAYRREVTRDVIVDTIAFLEDHWPHPYEFSLDGNHEGSFGDTNRPTVVFVRTTYDGFTRMAWQHTEGLELLVVNGKSRFPEVIDRVTDAGRDTFVIVANSTISSFLESHENDLEILGWQIVEREQSGLTTSSRFLLERQVGSSTLDP